MQIIEDVREAHAAFSNVVLTIGSFDGVHMGHQRVLDRVLRKAQEQNGMAAVLTMRPHPRELFTPNHAPNLLNSSQKKRQLFADAGIDVLFFLEFTPEVAGLDRNTFVEDILVCCCQPKTIVVGHDFCFGKDAAGDYDFLAAIGQSHGFDVVEVPAMMMDGERVSSTVIRERILQGDLEQAERFLGRKYSLMGNVISGRGMGAQLGFPTANVEPHHSAVPAQGVYIAEALIEGRAYPAAVNIGIAPTIRQEDIVIEAHLLDFHENIRNVDIEIVFHKRLRSEKKFNTHDGLIEQIKQDVALIRRYFA